MFSHSRQFGFGKVAINTEKSITNDVRTEFKDTFYHLKKVDSPPNILVTNINSPSAHYYLRKIVIRRLEQVARCLTVQTGGIGSCPEELARSSISHSTTNTVRN